MFPYVNYEKPYASCLQAPDNSNEKRANHWPEPSCDLMGCCCCTMTAFIFSSQDNTEIRYSSDMITEVEPKWFRANRLQNQNIKFV